MSTTDFRPGDRVRYSNASYPNLFGKLGTVVDPASLNKPGAKLPTHLSVKFDCEVCPDFFIRENFERQPIEPGCRVRWIEAMGGYITLENRIVKKVETSDWAGVDIVTFTDNLEVYAKDVVRIADPAPVKAAVDYRPGDRIRNKGNRLLGTVKATPADRTGSEWPNIGSIYYDPDEAKHNYYNDTPDMFERQPIEPGCFVREVPGSNVFGNGHRAERVLDVIDGKATLKGFLGGTFNVSLERLIRVAEPAPVAIKTDDISRLQIIDVYDPRHLKQAQDLAQALHAKHFSDRPAPKIGDDLTTVLNQIDNMTAGLTKTENCIHLEKMITRLADFIASEVPGEPSRSESAVDTAIRVMRRQEQALVSVCKVLRVDGPRSMIALDAWLAEYDPQPPVTFKRGDLVWTGRVHGNARIITNDPHTYATVDCMTSEGKIFRIPFDTLSAPQPE